MAAMSLRLWTASEISAMLWIIRPKTISKATIPPLITMAKTRFFSDAGGS